MIDENIADSAAVSNTGGGVEKTPGLVECKMNVMLMQAVPLAVENAVQAKVLLIADSVLASFRNCTPLNVTFDEV